MNDKTSMEYWFPKIEAAGLPVPRTAMVPMSREAFKAIYAVFDGKAVEPEAKPFLKDVQAAADGMGYPCFLRSWHTSGKHQWENTCHVAHGKEVTDHVISIIEYGELATLMGLPCDGWAVRELLPTKRIAVASRFGNMPLCREFRVFVDGGNVECWHPYWPLEALEQGGAPEPGLTFEALRATLDPEEFLPIARKAGAALGGRWSVDLLDTERGWFLTDMAEAEKSYHWPDCEFTTGEVNG